jgi:copper homeostasis protein
MEDTQMSKITLEICCGSLEDAKAAQAGGADRIELNSALYLGGLTPSLATLLLVKEQCTIPVAAMVRPRGGGFCYSDDEFAVMLKDAEILMKNTPPSCISPAI